jgi:hypothetical protein
MKKSIAVKTQPSIRQKNVSLMCYLNSWVLTVVLFFGHTAHAQEKFEIKPTFRCGLYRIDGRLIRNQQKFVILQGRPFTTVPYELILDGLPFEELFSRNNTQILVEVEIRHQETSSEPLRAQFKRFVSADEYTPNMNNYKLVKTLSCQ